MSPFSSLCLIAGPDPNSFDCDRAALSSGALMAQSFNENGVKSVCLSYQSSCSRRLNQPTIDVTTTRHVLSKTTCRAGWSSGYGLGISKSLQIF